MDVSAPATYTVLLAILARRQGTPQEIAKGLPVSSVHVHRVLRWLEDNGFVERGTSAQRGTRGRPGEAYVLVNPVGLVRAISLFRPLSRLRRFTLALDVSRSKAIAHLAERPIVFCLGTALERYSRFYRPDEVSFYAFEGVGPDSVDSLRTELSRWKEGMTRVGCYTLQVRTHGRRAVEPMAAAQILRRLEANGFAVRSRKGHYTTKVQTVVDLFGDGRAYAARDLIKELWGVEL